MKIGRALSGLLVVVLGVVLLLNNYGMVDWTIWYHLGKLWPVLFIVVGLLVFFDKSLLPVGIVLIILVIGLGFSGFFAPANNRVRSGVDRHSWQLEPHIDSANLKLSYGAGMLSVKDSPDNLVEFDLNYSGQRPAINYEVEREKAFFKVEHADTFQLKGFKKGVAEEWSILLAKDVSWDVDMDVGAAKVDLDFSRVKVKSIELDSGAGDITLSLGDLGLTTKIDIDSGASNIKVLVPEAVNLKIKVDGALNNSNLKSSGLVQSGDYYITKDTTASDSFVEIDVDAGVGNLELIRSKAL